MEFPAVSTVELGESHFSSDMVCSARFPTFITNLYARPAPRSPFFLGDDFWVTLASAGHVTLRATGGCADGPTSRAWDQRSGPFRRLRSFDTIYTATTSVALAMCSVAPF